MACVFRAIVILAKQ